jgi:hypothetical protein
MTATGATKAAAGDITGDGGGGQSAPARPDARRRRGRHRRLALLAVAVIVIIPLLYFFVIPRTELAVKVSYNESVLNRINVAAQLKNSGTQEVTDVDLDVSVVNSTDSGMGSREYSVGTVAPYMGVAKLQSLTFRGDQYERYTIVVTISFSAGGERHSRHFSHDTQEPWMNQDWTDVISG